MADTAHTDELIDDGPDAEAAAFDRWLEESEARLDAELADTIDRLLDVRAERAAVAIVTVPAECNVCGAAAEVSVVADADAERVIEIGDIVTPAGTGEAWTAWITDDGIVAANCGHRECQ